MILKSGVQIYVCGLATAPFAIREYFEKHFQTFDTVDEAMACHYENSNEITQWYSFVWLVMGILYEEI